jgi:hypothetical protein
MLCTSSTTFFAFMANAISRFPAIYTFGMWCSCLVVANFVAVNTVYVAVACVFDQYMATRGPCMICKRKVPEKKEDEVEVTPTDERKQASRPKTQVFFEVVVFGFCWKCRYLLVLVFLGLAVFFGYYAAQLTPDPNPPVLVPDTDPYRMFNGKLIDNYAALDNPFQIAATIVWGIQRDPPLDRTGTDPTRIEQRGLVHWLDIHEMPDDQVADFQTWIIDLCDDLVKKSKDPTNVLKIATKAQRGGRDDSIQCPWKHFKDYRVEVRQAACFSSMFRWKFGRPRFSASSASPWQGHRACGSCDTLIDC